MQFRHEVKHEITNLDMLVLRRRLSAVMQPDCHAVNGVYHIRSIYFDSFDDKALREKLDGVMIREKYRIRFYNHDPSTLHLERKFKCVGVGYKQSAPLTPEQALALVRGDSDWLSTSEDPVLAGFYQRMMHEGLRAKVVVDYIREPFVFTPGNVRVTLDSEIRTGGQCTDFLNPNCITVPIKDSPCIMEVKWDAFFPDIIRDAIQLGYRRSSAFSKYAASRMYD